MMAVLIEAYEATGAIALSSQFSLQELNLLISQTAEMRRDPEERQQEQDAEDAKRFMETNKGRKIEFRSARGEVEVLDLSEFELAEDE